MKPFKGRGRIVDASFPLRASWSWCPACGSLAVRHLLRGPGFECAHCHALTIRAPRVRVWDGRHPLMRVIRRADGGQGFILHQGREVRVRRQPDGSWRVVDGR